MEKWKTFGLDVCQSNNPVNGIYQCINGNEGIPWFREQSNLSVVMRESNKRLLLFREVSYTPKNYLPYLRRGDFLPEKTLPILILIFDKGSAQNYVLD